MCEFGVGVIVLVAVFSLGQSQVRCQVCWCDFACEIEIFLRSCGVKFIFVNSVNQKKKHVVIYDLTIFVFDSIGFTRKNFCCFEIFAVHIVPKRFIRNLKIVIGLETNKQQEKNG